MSSAKAVDHRRSLPSTWASSLILFKFPSHSSNLAATWSSPRRQYQLPTSSALVTQWKSQTSFLAAPVLSRPENWANFSKSALTSLIVTIHSPPPPPMNHRLTVNLRNQTWHESSQRRRKARLKWSVTTLKNGSSRLKLSSVASGLMARFVRTRARIRGVDSLTDRMNYRGKRTLTSST